MKSRGWLLLCLSIVGVLSACSPGPELPDHFKGRGLRLTTRFVGDPTVGHDTVVLTLGYMDLCDPQAPAPANPSALITNARFALGDGTLTFPFDNIDLSTNSTGAPKASCGLNEAPFFYRISATQGDDLGRWSSADELVFAPEPTTYLPFGPGGTTLELPQGYSLLRRSCANGSIDYQFLRPDDAVVELRRSQPAPQLDGAPLAEIERDERTFLADCGVHPPDVDLGTPVSFDRASHLAFTADGAGLVYLGLADPTSASSPLRTVALATGAGQAIADVPAAQDLTVDQAGRINVDTNHRWARVVTAADGTSALHDLVAYNFGAWISPDGRWVFADANVWDTETNTVSTPTDGPFVDWSPGSLLALSTPTSLRVRAVSGQPSTDFHFPGGDDRLPPAWMGETPILMSTPIDWTWYVVHALHGDVPQSCLGCYGLTLQRPEGAPAQQVLDASAGMLRLIVRQRAPFVLAWARTCLGLHNAVCSYALWRVTLADQSARVVAVAAQDAPVAVSPDASKIAIATTRGIFVKSLP